MKKTSHFITNNDGFILLHVLFVVTLLFILVTGAVSTYRNEVYITHRQIEQIKAETLFQMAREQYKTELQDSDVLPDNVDYSFPNGDVSISIFEERETYVKLNFIIHFPGKDAYLSVDHLFVLE